MRFARLEIDDPAADDPWIEKLSLRMARLQIHDDGVDELAGRFISSC